MRNLIAKSIYLASVLFCATMQAGDLFAAAIRSGDVLDQGEVALDGKSYGYQYCYSELKGLVFIVPRGSGVSCTIRMAPDHYEIDMDGQKFRFGGRVAIYYLPQSKVMHVLSAGWTPLSTRRETDEFVLNLLKDKLRQDKIGSAKSK
jgi:hypothetical protein